MRADITITFRKVPSKRLGVFFEELQKLMALSDTTTANLECFQQVTGFCEE